MRIIRELKLANIILVITIASYSKAQSTDKINNVDAKEIEKHVENNAINSKNNMDKDHSNYISFRIIPFSLSGYIGSSFIAEKIDTTVISSGYMISWEYRIIKYFGLGIGLRYMENDSYLFGIPIESGDGIFNSTPRPPPHSLNPAISVRGIWPICDGNIELDVLINVGPEILLGKEDRHLTLDTKLSPGIAFLISEQWSISFSTGVSKKWKIIKRDYFNDLSGIGLLDLSVGASYRF